MFRVAGQRRSPVRLDRSNRDNLTSDHPNLDDCFRSRLSFKEPGCLARNVVGNVGDCDDAIPPRRPFGGIASSRSPNSLEEVEFGFRGGIHQIKLPCGVSPPWTQRYNCFHRPQKNSLSKKIVSGPLRALDPTGSDATTQVFRLLAQRFSAKTPKPFRQTRDLDSSRDRQRERNHAQRYTQRLTESIASIGSSTQCRVRACFQ